MLDHLDAGAARRWAAAALANLADARDEIDGLNVFPVPDADTGTNLYLTVEAAVAAVERLDDDADLVSVLDACATGALLAARGNSGVILSQLLRGWADAAADRPDGGPGAVRDALARGAEQAYAAVGHPVEGTILTVAAAAAESAAATRSGAALAEVVDGALAGARVALQHTTEQLAALRRAGVVDAGGAGLVVLLEGLSATVHGRAIARAPGTATHERKSPGEIRDCADLEPGGPDYEVMYLLDAPGESMPQLREALDGLGDSVVVVGGGQLWNVHVHTDDVGRAIEAGIAAGRPHGVRVTHLVGQHASAVTTAKGASGDPARRRVAVVAGAAGPGLAAVFEQCGAVVVPTSSGRRTSTAEVLTALRGASAEAIVVLPNDPDTFATAQVAAGIARGEGIQVAVLPTRAAVQGLAAIAVHDPTGPLQDELVRMSAAAGAARHGGVTVAARQALTSVGQYQAGDVLGLVDGDVVVIGHDLAAVTGQVVSRMLSAGGELLTVVTGDDPRAADLARAVTTEVQASRWDVEVAVVEGGQSDFPVLLGVE